MATTKLGNTKQASRAINYAEKRAVEKSGLNCDVNYAKSSFKATRELYGKNDGVQAHTIIQSFKPGEVNEKQCNELGLELAKQIAPNHQVTVYTHNDKEHMHNHIVINSVNLETGKKYQSNNKQRDLIKQKNDEICRSHGLSVPEKNSEMRYTQSEYEMIKKGKKSWKDDLRQKIELSSSRNIDFESFQDDLGSLGIKTKLRGSTVSYLHSDSKRWVRAKKLGAKYELGGLENEFARQSERRKERTINDESGWSHFESGTTKRRTNRIKETEQAIKRQNDRDREVTRQEKSEDRPAIKPSRERDDGLEL